MGPHKKPIVHVRPGSQILLHCNIAACSACDTVGMQTSTTGFQVCAPGMPACLNPTQPQSSKFATNLHVFLRTFLVAHK